MKGRCGFAGVTNSLRSIPRTIIGTFRYRLSTKVGDSGAFDMWGDAAKRSFVRRSFIIWWTGSLVDGHTGHALLLIGAHSYLQVHIPRATHVLSANHTTTEEY